MKRGRTYVFDIDGTICFDGYSVDAKIVAAIEGLARYSRVALASARHPWNILELIPKRLVEVIDVVGANGAIASTPQGKIYVSYVDRSVSPILLSALDDLELPYLAYGMNCVVFSRIGHAAHLRVQRSVADAALILPAYEPSCDLVKVLGYPTEGQLPVLVELTQRLGIGLQIHSDGSVDILSRAANKREALVGIGYRTPFFAAFGNDANDLPVLGESIHRVAIGNHRDVRKISTINVPNGPAVVESICSVIEQLEQME